MFRVIVWTIIYTVVGALIGVCVGIVGGAVIGLFGGDILQTIVWGAEFCGTMGAVSGFVMSELWDRFPPKRRPG